MLELRAGEAAATVDPDGGARLSRLTVTGIDLLTDQGCFVMAPWAGRTGYGRFTFEGTEHRLPVAAKHAPHAIHGTVRDRPWTVVAADDRRAELVTDLGPDWPWAGTATQVVTLDEDHVTLELAVRTAGEPFPAVVGWHPWFAEPEGVDLRAGAMLERGDDRLPTGLRLPPPPVDGNRLDDTFEDVGWPVTLRRPDLNIEVDATGCRYAVVFTEPADATCIEPQTGPPDGLRTGDHTVVIEARPLAASTTWRWRRRG